MDEKKMLAREWVEVREESEQERIVLRPTSYDLPPARGRRWLDLSMSGYAAAKSPGPSDKMESKDGSWSLQGAELKVDAPGWTGAYRIEEVTENKLVLSPK